jgi:hypothetical protein
MPTKPPRSREEIKQDFDKRVTEISKNWDEKKHKRDTVGKFARKTSAEREQARKDKAAKRKATRLNDRWGSNPAERERALRNHAIGKLEKGEIKSIEEEIMKANGVADRKQLYANNELFDKLQESVTAHMRTRSGEKTRANEAQRAFDRKNPHHDPTRTSDKTQVDRQGGNGTLDVADRKRAAARRKNPTPAKHKLTPAEEKSQGEAFFKALHDNPGFAEMIRGLQNGGKPVKSKNVKDAITEAAKGGKYADHAKPFPGVIGNPTDVANALRKSLGKNNVVTYEDGSSVALINDRLWKIPAPKHTEDENTVGPKGAHATQKEADDAARKLRERLKAKKPRTASARTFPVPAVVASAWLGESATLDELDLVSRHGGDAGEWARRVLTSERDGVLVGALGGARTLPFGVVVSDDDIEADVVVALAIPGRGIIAGSIPDGMSVEYLTLDEDEVAYALRAINVDKADGVILRATTPIAFLTRSAVTADASLPQGTRMIAVVDPLDKNAVLDLVAVAPGPKVFRRNDGKWESDPKWVSILRSVRPPPVVEVTDALAASVVAQVDEATKGQAFEPTVLASADVDPFTVSLEADADRAALELLPILAAQGRIKSEVYDVAGVMPEQLQRYWLFGGGAAKIRWGTPGAWRRCHRLLTRYMGPLKSKGACTNLGQKLGGKGVAWDVGGAAKRAVS